MERKKQVIYNVIAFAFLFSVSLYRQLVIIFDPNNPFYNYIVYACYLTLTLAWAFSVVTRITQINIRTFLLLIDACIMLGFTLTFLGDQFFRENILVKRVGGFFVAGTALPIVLFGLYASLCIGRDDEYKIPRQWYLCLIPVVIMLMLMVTDEYHHFISYVIPEETQPNLNYHPNIGTFLIYALTGCFCILRVIVIYKRNNVMDDRPALKFLLPFFEVITVFILTVPYFINNIHTNPLPRPPEILEYFAKVYYVEVLTWEIYIYFGLVPANTDYQTIFNNSTLDMQIIDSSGAVILSKNALPLSSQQIFNLRKSGVYLDESLMETHIHSFSGYDFIWKRDVSALYSIIGKLNQTAETLAQESIILSEEIRTKNEQISLKTRIRLYDDLFQEVKPQIDMMKQLLSECNCESSAINRLFLIGTYIKRRCNLRLIQLETNTISADDIQISFDELFIAMKSAGISAELFINRNSSTSSEFLIGIFDAAEAIFEISDFNIKSIKIAIDANTCEICFCPAFIYIHDISQFQRIMYLADVTKQRDCYIIKLYEGVGANAK
ncbi:MAG: hypothetical protein IKH21_04990 [Clostridia bacterium]|nr:hypothetical protein [Clostridia bacterium]